MSVLTHDEIHKELASGRLRIEPFEADQVGAASVDLHLGDEFRVVNGVREALVHVTEEAEPETEQVTVADYYVLEPGHTVLGVTRERLCLPPDLCAWIEGRSRMARLGLAVHVTSGFVQPGVQNHQVLEMTNLSRGPLALHPGTRICQIVLERTEGQAVYRGRYADQSKP